MASIAPYLNFPGTTEEAFNFYKSVVGGEFTSLMRLGDTPDGAKLSAEDKSKIMHIGLGICGGYIMATDATESMGFTHKLSEGNMMHICLSPDSEEEAKKLFDGLSAGGKVGTPLQQMFWGDIYGDFIDKFGIRWMVNYTPKKN